jgi:hypothetical protein
MQRECAQILAAAVDVSGTRLDRTHADELPRLGSR